MNTAAATRAVVAMADASRRDDVVPRCRARMALRSRLAGVIEGMSILDWRVHEIAGYPGIVAAQYEPIDPAMVPACPAPLVKVKVLAINAIIDRLECVVIGLECRASC